MSEQAVKSSRPRRFGLKIEIKCVNMQALPNHSFAFPCGKRRQRIMNHQYVAIDLKSFYASVECVERKL
ncbi:MAG: hypothetical protein IJ074_09335, partial [Clostridia bacterium]|nr:hypothetical protein [Clostridia bacterium]